ncbi:hypothetical protein GMSM_42610 [Geomonas sp. Red276]
MVVGIKKDQVEVPGNTSRVRSRKDPRGGATAQCAIIGGGSLYRSQGAVEVGFGGAWDNQAIL